MKAARLSFPLVVKPADSMGARGCRAVQAEGEFAAAVADALRHSRSSRAIVEEYLDGPEFSLDALVVDGEFRLRGIADRHIAFAPYFVELGHTMPTRADPAIVAAVVEVFRAGIAALGLRRGAAKGDIKWCPGRGGAVVGEIAARLSGGYMSGWTYPYASGIEPTKEALLLAAGLEPGPAPADRGWASAERAWISLPGSCQAVIGLREAAASPFIKNVLPRAERGQSLRFPRNNVEKAGNVISQAPDQDLAAAAAEAAIRGILLRLSPGDAATESFLRGEGVEEAGGGLSWPPPAFQPPAPLAALLDAMPERLALSPEAGEASLAVLDFPEASAVAGLDWSGRGFLESARLALSLAGARFLPAHLAGSPDHAALAGGSASTATSMPAGRFWRAIARGGAQAGLYVLDCEKAGRQGA
jgi:hypothetical protein